MCCSQPSPAKPSPCTVCLTSNPQRRSFEQASTWSAKCDAACERRAGIPDCPHLTPAPQLPCCGPACLKLPAIRIRAVSYLGRLCLAVVPSCLVQ
ncbi:hypothetical protein M441DRAFT_298645 [Trichoderma asperellum CBS 433.97]|uniref:Uncharacterized protein n=1 Tax=Trichoderma asperellum (strain ATCC 204424 / CBS 433.97 / NBRC 101777) TaxID=1042311 RepID=A0A2T3YSV7_TRIA4|nr:hypothetical protein M441DRAFT_298645 [Trichoderma asperellum CBS 433.97]PTB35663.1 hypothetical protein M441DRAFT_298645 [Trichoderma asperellum CBS 433.97]WVH32607.1 hypothetical protein [Trichoderma asperellum]